MPLEDVLQSRGLDNAFPVERRAVRVVAHAFEGALHDVALPLTFTPFASAGPCSARCVFCSETLIHEEARVLSASLRPTPTYHAQLARALAATRGLPIGISLSGLEATDDPTWLEATLACIEAHEAAGGVVEEKVLYTNAAGLCLETHASRLVPRLQRFGLTRAEVSRHDPRQEHNDAIMRFRPGKPVAKVEVFAAALRNLRAQGVHVRLVCVLQQSGVASRDDVARYLAWAAGLGVDDVVFRELSRIDGIYQQNATLRQLEDGRVQLEPLLDEVWPAGHAPAFGLAPERAVQGYYYWNVQLRDAAGLRVTFETSDYRDMKARHRAGTVHKLVFHANGNLCGDWDPEREILVATRGP